MSESRKNRRILITGGAGFIGANFVHYWNKNHPADRIVVFDALTYAGNRNSISSLEKNPSYRFVQGNIGDQGLVEGLLRDEAIDTLVHFAAESHVDRSISGPDAFIETNIIGTYNLLKAARKVWLEEGASTGGHRFHHVSTDEVYGSLNADDPSFTELTAYAPNSPYSASKASSDHLVRAFHHTYGLNVTTSNCSNNYGPYQFPEKLIPLMILHALQGKELPIYGDGMNVRDWLFVDDHCRGIDMVIGKGKPGECYNIGGNNEWHNIDIVKLVCSLVDEAFASNDELKRRFPECPPAYGKRTEILIRFVKDRPGHDRRYAIDASKAAAELGYTPLETFDSGIRKTLDWYLHNEQWWRGVMDGSYREWIKEQYEGR